MAGPRARSGSRRIVLGPVLVLALGLGRRLRDALELVRVGVGIFGGIVYRFGRWARRAALRSGLTRLGSPPRRPRVRLPGHPRAPAAHRRARGPVPAADLSRRRGPRCGSAPRRVGTSRPSAPTRPGGASTARPGGQREGLPHLARHRAHRGHPGRLGSRRRRSLRAQARHPHHRAGGQPARRWRKREQFFAFGLHAGDKRLQSESRCGPPH